MYVIIFLSPVDIFCYSHLCSVYVACTLYVYCNVCTNDEIFQVDSLQRSEFYFTAGFEVCCSEKLSVFFLKLTPNCKLSFLMYVASSLTRSNNP